MELRAKDQEICLAYRLETFRLEDFASRLVLTGGPGIYTMCHAYRLWDFGSRLVLAAEREFTHGRKNAGGEMKIQDFKIQDFKISGFQDSGFQDFGISRFRISRFQDFKIQDFKI